MTAVTAKPVWTETVETHVNFLVTHVPMGLNVVPQSTGLSVDVPLDGLEIHSKAVTNVCDLQFLPNCC